MGGKRPAGLARYAVRVGVRSDPRADGQAHRSNCSRSRGCSGHERVRLDSVRSSRSLARTSRSFYGANVFPDMVIIGLEQPAIRDLVTGKFVLEVRENDDRDRELWIAVELSARGADARPDRSPTPWPRPSMPSSCA